MRAISLGGFLCALFTQGRGWSGLGHAGCVLKSGGPAPPPSSDLAPEAWFQGTPFPTLRLGAGWGDRLGSNVLSIIGCVGRRGRAVRSAPPGRLLCSTSVAFFSSSLMCSSRSTSCPCKRQQKRGLSTHLQARPPQWLSTDVDQGQFTQWQHRGLPVVVDYDSDPGRVRGLTWPAVRPTLSAIASGADGKGTSAQLARRDRLWWGPFLSLLLIM